jgi:gamma-glutamylputrescine oxidase
MSTSFWLDRSSKKAKHDTRFDAIVIGGGITGLSIAYWLLQEDPTMKVAVLEKNRLAFGASGRNAGFITCGSVEHFNRLIGKHGEAEAVEIWKFSEQNLKLLEERIVQDDKAPMQFEKKGSYSLAAQESEFNELKNVAKTMERIGIPVETLGAEDIQSRLGARSFQGGIRYLDDASVNPVKLVQQIAKKTQAQVIESCEVFGIENSGSGTRLVKTDQGVFETSMVAMGLNGYSSALHPYFNDKIYPTRGQILMMEPVERFMDGPCYANFYLDYFRQLPSGELLIGGFRQTEKATEVGFSDHITDGIQSKLHQFVMDHLPQFNDKKVSHRWGGIMGFSADGQPLIGALPEDNQVFFCGGYTGHGIGLAFNSAKSLVDVMFGRDIPKWISARRF